MRRKAKIFISISEGIIKKIPTSERRDYESEDKKSIILSYVPKKKRRKNSGSKGLTVSMNERLVNAKTSNIVNRNNSWSSY